MAKEDKQTQQQTQNSVSSPWGPTQGLLTKLISQYGGLNTGVTGAQTDAANNLSAATTGIPNFGDTGANAVTNLFSSSTTPQVGMLSDAYNDLKTNLGGTASGAELNPWSTPGFSDALGTLTQNITNATKGVYAGSGRDPSGAGSFSKSLGLGLTQGLAPILQSQFNQNKANQMNAASTLFNAGGSTASGITGQNQVPLQNSLSALGAAPMLSNLYTSPAQAQLAAANNQYGLPFMNLQQLLNPATQMAALGGQTSGTSNTVTTQPQNTMSNVLGGISGGIGLLSFLSDENAKENIKPVGKLHDGQKVYRYNYKGDPRPQIGLLAQEVAEHEPDAVSTHPKLGMLMVDYGRATRRAAGMRKAA